jgi:hypothetical protein
MPFDFNGEVQRGTDEDRKNQKILREQVQGADVNRIPKECKNPDGCPMINRQIGGIPSVCFELCGIRS